LTERVRHATLPIALLQPDGPMDARDILDASRFFHAVEGTGRETLLAMAHLKDFRRGETIFEQGDPCPGIYVVGEGTIRVYKLAPNGREHVLHFVSRGGTFAEVAAIGDFPCPAFAEAEADGSALLLPKEPFLAALRTDHQLCLQLMGSMAGWVKHLVGLLEDLTLRDAVGRVARYLLDLRAEHGSEPAELLRLPSVKKNVASHLSLTSETLSRSLRRLADLKLIETHPEGRLRLLDVERLERAAQGELPVI
jgi:CRP/FNR family transcriptional regulator, dissimilatory nitrate respiration regulator